uniref:(northern house mosquito) hypothetical protein n=1 Tax=Culex pipiens TaxID=7175 RepID=A0A8D8P509_CULPI
MSEIHTRMTSKDEEEGVIFIEHIVSTDRVCDYAATKSPPQNSASSGRSSVVEGRLASDEFDYEIGLAGGKSSCIIRAVSKSYRCVESTNIGSIFQHFFTSLEYLQRDRKCRRLTQNAQTVEGHPFGMARWMKSSACPRTFGWCRSRACFRRWNRR